MAVEDLELKLQQELSRRVVRLLPGNVDGHDDDPSLATGAAAAIFTGASGTSEYTQSNGLRWKKHGEVWYIDDWPGMPLVELTGAGEITVLGDMETNKRWFRVNRSADEVFDLGPTTFGFSCVIEEGVNGWSITTQVGITYTGPDVAAGEAVLIIAKSPTTYFGYQFGSSGGGGGVGRNSWDNVNLYGTIVQLDPTPDGPGLTVGSVDFFAADGTVTYERYDVAPLLVFYSENGGGDALISTGQTGGGMLIGSAMSYGLAATAEVLLGGGWQEKIFGGAAAAGADGTALVLSDLLATIAGTYVYASGVDAYATAEARGPGNYIAGGYVTSYEGPWAARIFLDGYWGTGMGNLAFGRVRSTTADAEMYAAGIGGLVGGHAFDAAIRAGFGQYEDGNIALGSASGFNIEAGGGDGNLAFGAALGAAIEAFGYGTAALGAADSAAIQAFGTNAFQFGPGTNTVNRSLAVLEDFRFRGGGLGFSSPTVEFSTLYPYDWELYVTLVYDGTVVNLTSFYDDSVTAAADFNVAIAAAGLGSDIEAVVTSRAGQGVSVTIQVIIPETSEGKQMTASLLYYSYGVNMWDVTDGAPGTQLFFTNFDRTGAAGVARFGDFWWDADRLKIQKSTNELVVAEEHDVLVVAASRDLTLADRNKTLNVTGAYTLTITPAMAIQGMRIHLIADGANAITIQQDSGTTVTLTCPKGTVNNLAQDTVLSLGADGDELFLTFISDTECRVTGDVA